MAKKKQDKPRSDADRRVRQCERLARLMKTLHLISGKGRWDAAALAEELGCSRRTVHRLLQTLSMAGVPWYFDEKTRAYRVRPGYKFPTDGIEQPEAVSERSNPRLKLAASQALKDGEAFAKSLDELLGMLRTLSERQDNS